jgi:hypothetical protein
MIVERWTWTAKVGRRDEFVEMIKALLELNGFAGRVCTFEQGPFDKVTFYQEFESMEDRQEVWDAIDWSRPEVVELTEKWDDLIETGTTSEILRVH